eukprot:gnl/MRDRNA2_/MRDRNA2_155154_c0_seq1.p1 gnl/MRDRNA2_/MRDRNA2_155154_c0~~gnl/MRDRNA2_/MRDRNA2_155154_c0_seq1.p1  ORF type:complete len:284 (+),score=42.94 gnl/MRDRNA2_/MRDRNA2_155154_c0_seq1:93-854(+)
MPHAFSMGVLHQVCGKYSGKGETEHEKGVCKMTWSPSVAGRHVVYQASDILLHRTLSQRNPPRMHNAEPKGEVVPRLWQNVSLMAGASLVLAWVIKKMCRSKKLPWNLQGSVLKPGICQKQPVLQVLHSGMLLTNEAQANHAGVIEKARQEPVVPIVHSAISEMPLASRTEDRAAGEIEKARQEHVLQVGQLPKVGSMPIHASPSMEQVFEEDLEEFISSQQFLMRKASWMKEAFTPPCSPAMGLRPLLKSDE